MDISSLAKIMGGSGAAAIMGQQAPAQERQQLLANDLSQERLLSATQTRQFEAQNQPLNLEQMMLRNQSAGLKNRDDTVDVQAKEQLGPQYQVDKARGEQDKASIERTLKQVEGVGHAAAMLASGMPPLELQSWMTHNLKMPPAMASEMISLGPKAMQDMATNMQMSTKQGELQTAKLAAQAKAAEEAARARQIREERIQEMKAQDNQLRAFIAAMTKLQVSREHESGATARSNAKGSKTSPALYPKGVTGEAAKMAIDMERVKYPDEDFSDVATVRKHTKEILANQAALLDAKRTQTVAPDGAVLGLPPELTNMMPPTKQPTTSISGLITGNAPQPQQQPSVAPKPPVVEKPRPANARFSRTLPDGTIEYADKDMKVIK